ncbi:fasciclin domain-containing protein [Thiohalocapsa halophila]
MTESTNTPNKKFNYGPLAVFGLAMALGPLTALSVGSRYAPEETFERANAALENAKPTDMFSIYDMQGVPAYASGKTLGDILASSGVFGSFKEAVDTAGLSDTLRAKGEYTLFVPSDEALAKMPAAEREALLSDKDQLTALIKKHMIPGRHTATDLIQSETVQAMDGSTLDIGPSARFNGHVGVANAEVVKTGLYASNGVVHVIDRVIQ